MSRKLFILVGTVKGAFIIESDADRRAWDMRGPFCDTWPINHFTADPSTGTLYAGGGGAWVGPGVWTSADLGASWTRSSEGLTYGEGEEPIKSVWSLSAGRGRLYAGVEPAGLFESADGGDTWRHVAGLRNHPSRPEWQPGGAGLILHGIMRHPDDDDQIWVAMSAVGVFHTADAGETWQPRNRGTRNDYMPEDRRYPEFGQCVHAVAMAPGVPDRLYQQNHCGMYRSGDGGQSWESMEAGLPSSFGFPVAVHPRDPDTVYLVPLNGDIAGRYVPDGKAAVWRTRDGGDHWEDLRTGLPQGDAFFTVLRQAMATDPLTPAGIYFGTGNGILYASADEGDSWNAIAQNLPRILSVETLATDV